MKSGETEREGPYEVVCVDEHGIFHVREDGRVIKRYTADSFDDVWLRLEQDQTSGRI